MDRKGGGRPRIVGIAGAVWICALAAGDGTRAAASEGPGGALLEQARERWRSHPTIEARFEQVQHFVGFDEPLLSTGRLRILRPRYFDLQYDPPYDQRQVCDGSHVWTYMNEQRQVFKAILVPDAARSADLLEWALEGAKALGAAVPDTTIGVAARRIDLRPGPNLPLRALAIWLQPGGPDVVAYEAIDTEGNRTRLRLLSVRHDLKMARDAFQFTPPDGVEVIEIEGAR